MIPLGTHSDPNTRQHPTQRLPAWPWLAALLLAGAAVWLGAGRPNPAGRQAEDVEGAEALETPPADAKPKRELTSAEAGRKREWARQRERMVELDLRGRDIRNRRVLAALGKVPRHEFVPSRVAHLAYADRALPIGHEQTISQPYIVALMTQAADPQPEHRTKVVDYWLAATRWVANSLRELDRIRGASAQFEREIIAERTRDKALGS